jgi:hypothetical protein
MVQVFMGKGLVDSSKAGSGVFCGRSMKVRGRGAVCNVECDCGLGANVYAVKSYHVRQDCSLTQATAIATASFKTMSGFQDLTLHNQISRSSLPSY